jgi:putative hydrolase of the HAD superfamily
LIKNIIFDLGNVLVNVEYQRFIDKLKLYGVDDDTYKNFFKGAHYRLLGYESGEISTEDFIKKCISGLNIDMSFKEYADAFNDMFSEIPQMSNLVKLLKSNYHYKLYLLSNTSPLHFDYITEKFQYINLLDNFALSYKLKSLKPEDNIYIRAIQHLNIIPEESLFIDDLEENCAGAEKFGIKTICYNKNNHSDFESKFSKYIN